MFKIILVSIASAICFITTGVLISHPNFEFSSFGGPIIVPGAYLFAFTTNLMVKFYLRNNAEKVLLDNLDPSHVYEIFTQKEINRPDVKGFIFGLRDITVDQYRWSFQRQIFPIGFIEAKKDGRRFLIHENNKSLIRLFPLYGITA